ncbi:MAG: hypothetical protein MPJ50_14140 [Pirellulales bacterium]|nr:hypothetical protein [Pirellulales bacterium]
MHFHTLATRFTWPRYTGKTGRHRGRFSELGFALLVFLLAGSLGAPASAQDAWHSTAYRMHAAVIFEPGPAVTQNLRDTLLRDLKEQCDNVFGANWDLDVVVAGQPWRIASGGADEEADYDELVQLMLELDTQRLAAGKVESLDKVFIIYVACPPSGWKIMVRELDVATRVLGHPVVRDIPQQQILGQSAFAAMLEVFAPLARIEESDTDDVRLGLRAEALLRRDPNLHVTQPGDLFQPIIRQNNRDGTPKGIRPVAWTYLRINESEVAEPVDGEDGKPVVRLLAENSSPNAIVNATTYSALKTAFRKRRRGREEKYALAVRITHPKTTLKAVDLRDVSRGLEGYEIIAYTPDSPVTTRLGRTNDLGEITIPADDNPLHLLLVRSGRRMLARLPIVPGSQQVAQIELTDDRERLQIEGFITGLQEEMVGVFTHRELLMNLIRDKLNDDNIDGAQALMERLRRLPTAESFRQRIQAKDNAYFGSDAHVNKLFDDTRKVLDRFFQSGPVRELQREIDSATVN